MTVLLPFAFLSGIVTILSPCILPVLPVLLTGGFGGKARPLGIVSGFIVSFSVFTLFLTAIVQALSIPADSLRWAAVIMITGLGVVMAVPALSKKYEAFASRLVSRKKQNTGTSSGYFGGLSIGMGLGLVWTPCVGPIMASVVGLAAAKTADGGSLLIVAAYALGTSIPMLAVMFGGRTLINRVPALSRHGARLKQVFGVLMMVVGLSIGMGWDLRFQAKVLEIFPNYGSGLTFFEDTEPVREALNGLEGPQSNSLMTGAPVLTVSYDNPPKNGTLSDFGQAPPIVTTGEWFNTERPLSMDELRGKVVLIDFWTYSCINCVRTLPYLRAWYERYAAEGLVIIGVHTPEFAFERKPQNVEKAMKDLGVTWPVVLDNDYQQWQAYSNRYWPAHYFIDAEGRIRYYHFGEGKYEESEDVIRQLLAESGSGEIATSAEAPAEIDNQSRTHETYLGYARTTGFAAEPPLIPDRSAIYAPKSTPENGEWNLTGEWTAMREYVVPSGKAKLELGFYAKNVYLVIEPSDDGGDIEVLIDGEKPADSQDLTDGRLAPRESRLYEVASLPEAGNHVLTLHVDGDIKLYAFTFG